MTWARGTLPACARWLHAMQVSPDSWRNPPWTHGQNTAAVVASLRAWHVHCYSF